MRLFATFIAALLAPLAAHAATIYSDAGTWNSAMSSTTSVPLPDTNGGVNSFSAGDLNFTRSGSASNLVTANTADYWSTLIPGIDLAISSPEDVTITFGSAVTGFSFLLHEPSTATGGNNPPDPDTCNTSSCFDTTFNFKLLSGVTELASFSLNPTDDSAVFVGFSSLTAFDKVVIDDVTNTIDNEYFGDFKTGSIAPIPLPATLPLLLASLGGLSLLVRRRAKS